MTSPDSVSVFQNETAGSVSITSSPNDARDMPSNPQPEPSSRIRSGRAESDSFSLCMAGKMTFLSVVNIGSDVVGHIFKPVKSPSASKPPICSWWRSFISAPPRKLTTSTVDDLRT
eukprot:CAMPEP_0194372066 /NCGR_PEP_ID=MMETSP0174-20130528/20350_1 /TAXON_ID=216777 /ORGANISM="Proboscia alata, Strain PI-D3" /LENGTH=115 /DNA_ID=CAMNT_0039150343 /DNA_START=364 /DNA_END=711 /DNA_ORIENTATION=+